MSNPTSNAPSKLGNASSPLVSPAPSQLGSISSDTGTRRSGGSGSFGAGQSTRSLGGQPRNKQGARNQHKQSRRYLLADEDAMAETTAMRSFTNRKGQTSITHLMNFALPPRPSNHYNPSNHRHVKRNPTWGLGSGYHAVDKARYVHANYRFIVDPRGDYQMQSTNADVYLEWASILQILASPTSQSAACPICLGDPVASRMAKCGHIFCLPCLIRYMHSVDDTSPAAERKVRWKKCPICWDAIYVSDVRPLRWYQGQEPDPPREGGDIVLRLVARPAGSTLALPREASTSSVEGEEIPWHYAADVMDFSRVMKGTEEYMLSQYDNEIEQLEQLERHDEVMFGEDAEWTSKAARSIRDAKDRMRELSSSSKDSQSTERSKRRTRAPPTSAPNESDPVTTALSTSITAFRAQQYLDHQPHTQPSDYYFYQALLHYYLSPLDIRILRSAFGSFSNFPTTILPRIERISTGHVVDDELRRRAKYLAHLPHGCEVSFLECDWTDTVPASVLEIFNGDIEKRRKRNQEKDAREERERVRAEREEDEQRWAAARRRRSNPADHGVEKTFLAPGESITSTNNVTQGGHGAESTSPVWTPLTRDRNAANGSSFASLASPSTSPSESRTVWGTAAVAPSVSSPTLHSAELTDRGAPDDGWLQGWETDLLDNDNGAEIIAQAEALSLSNELTTTGEGGKGSWTKDDPVRSGIARPLAKKKGKGKKITLMSTNARRGA